MMFTHTETCVPRYSAYDVSLLLTLLHKPCSEYTFFRQYSKDWPELTSF